MRKPVDASEDAQDQALSKFSCETALIVFVPLFFNDQSLSLHLCQHIGRPF